MQISERRSEEQLSEGCDSLAQAFLKQCRSRPHHLAVADSSGVKLTYEQLLVAAITLSHTLADELDKVPCVGILLPPSVGAAIANLAVVLLGKVPVNLNYTFSQAQFAQCVETCGLNHIIASRRALDHIPIKTYADLIILEDVKENLSIADKIRSWLEAELLPEFVLRRLFDGLNNRHRFIFNRETGGIEAGSSEHESRLCDPATIVFTAGSTALPKGVVLSHKNILSNIQAIRNDGHVEKGEVVLGVIPFFHSFGQTMTLWAPLCLGESVVYHYDPLDGARVGKLCQEHGVSTLVCTPTMMSLYMRRSAPGNFASVRSFILGGEKLSRKEFVLIQQVFEKSPLEGYGLAETSPVISCNVHGLVPLDNGRLVEGVRAGSVGRPLSGTKIRIVDPQTWQDLPVSKEGLILVWGPQVMLGYLDNPAATSAAVHDGWLNTGDMGKLDDDGFLTITGRLNQFSKIAGEMVPHLAVREELIRVTGLDESQICVSSVADELKGERLVVLVCRELDISDVLWKLRESPISRLWIPDAEDFVLVHELPVLANGKLDLRGIKQLAENSRRSRGKTWV